MDFGIAKLREKLTSKVLNFPSDAYSVKITSNNPNTTEYQIQTTNVLR